MLLELRINNLALIDSLELDFSGPGKGLVVFTGETGAGKSIILQGLHLLAGRRGSVDWIRRGYDQGTVEAVFGLRPDQDILHQILTEHGLPVEEECLIRRVVARQGRSRIFVNDQQVTGRLVAQITTHLVNLASQHDQQQLLAPRNHLDFLDTYGELQPLRQEFGRQYRAYRKMCRKLEELRGQERDKEQRRDFLAHQLAEIREADLQPGEDEVLARERDRLKAVRVLEEQGRTSYQLLQREIIPGMVVVRQHMEQIREIDHTVAELASRCIDLSYEIEDLEQGLRVYLDNLAMEPERLEEINARLSLLRQLQRKYGVTLEEVIDYGRRAAAELEALGSLEQQVSVLEKQRALAEREVCRLADQLSHRRRQVADRRARALESEMASLSFMQVRFEVAFKTGTGDDRLTPSGQDSVEFLFSANPGEDPRPLARVVSGGELSRLMLAFKCLLARKDAVETVIFDEVDAGVSGQAAEAVAAKIRELAGHHQVLCITHLPQIAAYGDLHFRVEKEVRQARTRTRIRLLDDEERVAEIGRMLGGDHPSPQTLAFAGELLGRSRDRGRP